MFTVTIISLIFKFDSLFVFEHFCRVDQVADAISQVLHLGKHGTIWKVEGGELEEVSITQYYKLRDEMK